MHFRPNEEKGTGNSKKSLIYIFYDDNKLRTQIYIDTALGDHLQRVAELSNYLGEILGLSEQTLGHLDLGSYLHDIGKTMIPERILYKPGKLTEEEERIMLEHADIGAGIAYRIGYDDNVYFMIKNHHLPYLAFRDKTGLVQLQTQIISVADAFDAMIDPERTYQEQMTIDGALNRLGELSGTKFNPEIVNALIMSVDYLVGNYFQTTVIEQETKPNTILLN